MYRMWMEDIFLDFGAAPNRRRVRCTARGVLIAMHPSRAYFILGPVEDRKCSARARCYYTSYLPFLITFGCAIMCAPCSGPFELDPMGFLLIPIHDRHTRCIGSCLRILHVSFPCCRFQLVHCILVAVNLIPCIGG